MKNSSMLLTRTLSLFSSGDMGRIQSSEDERERWWTAHSEGWGGAMTNGIRRNGRISSGIGSAR